MDSCKSTSDTEEVLTRAQLIEHLKKNRLFSLQEVAIMLNVTVQTLRRAVNAGKIKTIHIARFVRIPTEEVERLLKGNKTVLTVKEASELLNVSAAAIRMLINAGKIQAFRLADKGTFKIAKSEIERIVREGTSGHQD